MTTAIAEVTSLENLDLESTPPCEAFRFNYEDLWGPCWPCQEPSVVRVRFHHCVHVIVLFICAECLKHLKAGRIRCAVCGSMQGDYEWREM